MKVRIEIPLPNTFGNYPPNQIAARRMQFVRRYLVDSRLKSIMDMHQIDYRILENFVFAVVEIKMACDLHVLNAKENNAVGFRTTYDD
jgi:hypothetical protein